MDAVWVGRIFHCIPVSQLTIVVCYVLTTIHPHASTYLVATESVTLLATYIATTYISHLLAYETYTMGTYIGSVMGK